MSIIVVIRTLTFSQILLIYMRPKKKILRVNDAPLMNKELRKAIYTRSRLGTLKTPPKRMKRPIKNNGISVSHNEVYHTKFFQDNQ